MSRFLSDRFVGLEAYVPGEQPKDKKYIKLNTNESPYAPSPGVKRAVNEGAISDLRLYGDPNCTQLKKLLAECLSVSPENIFLGNGSDEILSFAFMAFCDGKTGVSYPDISYGFYPVYGDLYNLRKNEIPLRENFSISAEDYLNLQSTIVIANPNAPTGLCLSTEDIERIVAGNRNNVVVIDEAYIDFGGKSCVPLMKAYDNLLVVQTFSKSRSLAGARLGFAVGSAGLIGDLEKLRYSTNPYNVASLNQLAGVAAMQEQDYYDDKIAKIIETRSYTSEALKKMGFFVTDSRANFLFVRHPKHEGRDIYLKLRERGILVRHFAKERINDFVRITIGTPEQMEAFIVALKEIGCYA